MKEGVLLWDGGAKHTALLTSDQERQKTIGSPCVLESNSAWGSSYDDTAAFETGASGDGALQPGGAFPLFSRESIGLLCQYAGVGILSGMLPQLAYPIFTQYLRMEGYQIASYVPLVNFAWSWKVFAGIASDCFPIYGYKRKSYIVLGWCLALICCAAMALTPFPAPRYANALKGKTLTSLTPDEVAAFTNPSAAADGYKFVLWSMGATFGFVLADVAADAVMVQHAQREPLHMRGRIQTMIYVVREVFRIVPQVVIGICLNDFQYGGTFDFSVAPSVIYWLLTASCGLSLVASVTLLVETPTPSVPFREYMQGLWDLLHLRVMWQTCAFRYISYFAVQFDATPRPIVQREWVHVTPLNNSIYAILGVSLNAITYYLCGRFGLHWNWRTSMVVTSVVAVAIDAGILFPTIWGAARGNQHLFLAISTAENVPKAAQFIISSYCTVELADLGNEGAVHGLITTIANLAWPVAAMLFKTVDAFFDTANATIKSDTTDARWQVTYCFIIAYAFKLGWLATLSLLPKQKAHLQLLKRRGRRDAYAGPVIVSLFLGLLCYQFVSNALSLFPSTWCWRMAGGKGLPVGATTCPKN
ncbi:Aste57867_10704 [Aphanomyces stellatus]|uniref:Aste57867_10704 protein n=1 Tax=Aphanomyces stellatus TaxID=120398 RepID=A0A485KRI0_9STRA|nr:hypothetical protein As57867_010664 [Aphanomyces stellatus]VFT87574.1 Aste57867_10704 [Aphanomyces stellatus]